MMYPKFAVLAVSALLAAVGGQAQDMLQAKIPFDFRVGKALLPAGDYTISKTGAPSTILVKPVNHKGSGAIVLTGAVGGGNKRVSEGKLVFNRYGDNYFLNQVWRPGIDTGYQLMPTRTEREMAAAARRSPGVEIAAGPAR